MNRISVVIPPTSNDSWKNLPKEELAYWNLTTDQGNAALHDLECVDPVVYLSGVDQGPQDVVVEVPEPQGDAA